MKYDEQKMLEREHKIEARIRLLTAQHDGRIAALNAQHACKMAEQARLLEQARALRAAGDPVIREFERMAAKRPTSDFD